MMESHADKVSIPDIDASTFKGKVNKNKNC